MFSLAALSDKEYQLRTWLDPASFDSFDQCVHTLFDDTDILPDPRLVVGAITCAGDEISRLAELGNILETLIDEHGDASDDVYMHDPAWPEVMRLAGLALAAMVRA